MKLTNKFLPNQYYDIYYDNVYINNYSNTTILINTTGYVRKKVYRVDDYLYPFQQYVRNFIEKDFVLKLKVKQGVAYCESTGNDSQTILNIVISDYEKG